MQYPKSHISMSKTKQKNHDDILLYLKSSVEFILYLPQNLVYLMIIFLPIKTRVEVWNDNVEATFISVFRVINS